MKQRNFSKKSNTQQRVPRARRVTVKEESTLLAYLFTLLAEQSKSSVKALLANRQISVNGKVTTQFDLALKPEDEVGISFERGKVEFNHPLLKIVWEDDFLIVVEKRSGLLSMSTEKEKERTAYHLLTNYVQKSNEQNRVFILHRLDKDTSGLMMFAKDRQTQNNLQSTWSDSITARTYVAVVEGRPEKESDLICLALSENSGLKVYVAEDGSEAVTRYKVLRSNDKYSLLELDLETGRKNQIRAHMEYIGCPIAGDPKYGARTNPAGRLALHARKLWFIHPVTKEEMRFETVVPSVFNAMVKKS